MGSLRHDDRPPQQIRPLEFRRHYTESAPGSVLVTCGKTIVLCTASVADEVPPWMAGRGKGWITAEYSMLPGSTRPRKGRDRGPKIDGRTTEIQRLIGRSVRAVADLQQLGERTITLDCDVLQADGGTRTASINGALIALVDALRDTGQSPATVLRETVAAISVGLVGRQVVADLDYREDVAAAVDMNVVMTGRGNYVEVQGTGEEATFTQEQLTELLTLARLAIDQVIAAQRSALDAAWPWAT